MGCFDDTAEPDSAGSILTPHCAAVESQSAEYGIESYPPLVPEPPKRWVGVISRGLMAPETSMRIVLSPSISAASSWPSSPRSCRSSKLSNRICRTGDGWSSPRSRCSQRGVWRHGRSAHKATRGWTPGRDDRFCVTRRWREMDSNSRSPGCGEARRNPIAGRFIEDLRTLFEGRSGCTRVAAKLTHLWTCPSSPCRWVLYPAVCRICSMKRGRWSLW